MSRRVTPWPDNPTDREVQAWLEAKGIREADVRAYTIHRSPTMSEIIITFVLDDPPASEFLPTTS